MTAKEPVRYWQTRVPAPNPSITDPIWPGDPFWRSKKYPRELRAKIAHEWHHDPSEPSLHALSQKHGVSISSLTMWCAAYPFGSRPMLKRNYTRHIQPHYYYNKERIEAALTAYTKELRKVSVSADLTWKMMGDPLPSRCAKNIGVSRKTQRKITLPHVPLR